MSENEPIVFEKWICTCCGYVYEPEIGDPERGIPPGTPFEKLPDGWTCPLCYAMKASFDRL